jgi:hypothetical protein
MRKVVFCLIVLSVLFYSCKKKTAKADVIVYTDIEPDLILNSVRSTSLHGSGWFQVDLPVDTSCSASIKIGTDKDVTFIFSASNSSQPTSPSAPHVNYNKALSLTVNNSYSIATLGSNPCIQLLNNQDVIDQELSFSNETTFYGTTYLHGPGGAPFNCNSFYNSGDKYIAFKRIVNKTVNFGWIRVESIGTNGIKIKELAINIAHNRKILAGQKN